MSENVRTLDLSEDFNYKTAVPPKEKLDKLRKVITENLRIQQSGAPTIPYIDVAHAVPAAKARQNHVIFGRRGCGKTLLLEDSGKELGPTEHKLYLDCEAFKNHTFPNVLVEIIDAVLGELQRHMRFWWFGKKKVSKQLISDLRHRLAVMRSKQDETRAKVVERSSAESATRATGTVGAGQSAASTVSTSTTGIAATGQLVTGYAFTFGREHAQSEAAAIERAYETADSKIGELNILLPQLKENLKKFFGVSSRIKTLFLQIDDFYHLARPVQPYVMDYIHRLCKDLPIYFKVATLRHASVLYAERLRDRFIKSASEGNDALRSYPVRRATEKSLGFSSRAD
jgi:Cdc6-like AAA superfamily ATPase